MKRLKKYDSFKEGYLSKEISNIRDIRHLISGLLTPFNPKISMGYVKIENDKVVPIDKTGRMFLITIDKPNCLIIEVNENEENINHFLYSEEELFTKNDIAHYSVYNKEKLNLIFKYNDKPKPKFNFLKAFTENINNYEKLSDYQFEMELHAYGIEYNYTINSDRTIDIDGDIDLSHRNLKQLPFRFGKVTGTFDCSFNYLTNLIGSPSDVGDNFYCNNNNLSSLEGCPTEVGGHFDCSVNHLDSLKGCPSEIGYDLQCFNNKLTDLDITSVIGGNIVCCDNKIDPNDYHFYGDLKGEIYFNYEDQPDY